MKRAAPRRPQTCYLGGHRPQAGARILLPFAQKRVGDAYDGSLLLACGAKLPETLNYTSISP